MVTGREPNIVACMAKAEQAKVLARQQKAIARCELDEQKLFAGWLRREKKAGRLHYIWPRGDKASTIAPGHPDFSIWLSGGRTMLLEFKLPGRCPSEAQDATISLLQSLKHHVVIVGSAIEAERLLNTLHEHPLFLYDHPKQDTNQAASSQA